MLQKQCASFEARKLAPQDEVFRALHDAPHPEVLCAAKPRRTHIVLAALTTLFFLSPTLAHACSCIRIAPEGFRQQAAVIIEGKVMSVKREGDINGRVIARIAVSKLVKGQAPRTVTVSTGGNSAMCGVTFSKGQRGEFLLARENGRLSTNICLMMGAKR
ncbi:MAG: hypothetical protein ACRCWF_13845 [Beijerinckiaceae bacterium]